MKIRIGRKAFNFLRRDSDPGQMPRSRFDYAAEVKDGLGSATIVAPALWVMRQFPEAPIAVRDKDGELHFDHPLAQLLRHPNPWYGGGALKMGLALDFVVRGNGYMEMGRGRGNRPERFYYQPSYQVTPKGNDTELVTHFEHATNRGTRRIDLSDMCQFRNGINPNDAKTGIAPLQSLLREIFTDDEAANMTAAILRNMGVPGIVVSPAHEESDEFGPVGKTRIKRYFRRMFRGDHAGDTLVLNAGVKVDTIGVDFAKMNIHKLRQIPEERACAVFGIPAAVVGFGTGMEQTKVGAPQPLSATLWTLAGPITMGEAQKGQLIATPTGWSQIQEVYPQGEQDIYRVTFQDGSTAESTLDHLWTIKTPNISQQTLPLSGICKFPNWKLRRTYIPEQGVIEFAEQPLLIPPYLMGLLLGDGTFRSNLSLSNTSTEIIDSARRELPADYALIHASRGDYRITYKAARDGRGLGNGSGGINPFKNELRRLGLWMKYSHEKFIPELYKYNSVETRKEILRGILDSDGYVNLHGQPTLEQTSRQLADDVTFLVQSLGGYTLCAEKKVNTKTRLIAGRPIRSRFNRISQAIVIDNAADMFRCSEKKNRARARIKRPTRKFRSVEYVRREHAQCIKINGALYLTDNFVVTHNTMKELRELAHENVIIPMQRVFAEEMDRTLLPEFEPNPEDWSVVFDNSQVRVLQEDETRMSERSVRQWQGGLITRAEGRVNLGLETTPADEVYRQGFSDIMVPASALPTTDEDKSGNEWIVKALKGDDEGRRQRERLVDAFDADARTLSVVWADELQKEFEAIGRELADLWLAESVRLASRNGDRKADLPAADQAIIDEILTAYPVRTPDYDGHYIRVLHRTAETIEHHMALGVMMSDPMERTVVMRGVTRRQLIDFTAQTQTSMYEVIAQARSEGLGPPAIARRIRDQIPAGPHYLTAQTRAEIIAQAETKFAQNVSSMEVYKNADNVTGIQFFDARHGDTHDPVCVALDGQIMSVEDAERIEPTQHPNCLPGSAMVLAPNLRATFTRWFEGELIILRTADNQLLSCTPNHPILTDAGWVAAQNLSEGDYVISSLDTEGIARWFDPNNDQVPATIQQIAGAFGMARGVTTEVVPGAAKHFHGDGSENNVTVIRTNGFLERTRTEHREQITLKRTDLQLKSFDRLGVHDLLAEGLDAPAHSFMSGGRESLPLGRSVTGHIETLSLGTRAKREAPAAQCGPESTPGRADGRADLVGAFSGLISGKQCGVVEIGSRPAGPAQGKSALTEMATERSFPDTGLTANLCESLAGLIAPVKLIEIYRRQFSGHVYNLQTDQGWYVADGIITHNCSRSMAPVVGEREEAISETTN